MPTFAHRLRNETLPRCAKCKTAIKFQLIRPATALLHEHGFRVFLYELPEGEAVITSIAVNFF